MSRKGGEKMDMRLVQIIQNKVLCGIALSEIEKAILKKIRTVEKRRVR